MKKVSRWAILCGVAAVGLSGMAGCGNPPANDGPGAVNGPKFKSKEEAAAFYNKQRPQGAQVGAPPPGQRPAGRPPSPQ